MLGGRGAVDVDTRRPRSVRSRRMRGWVKGLLIAITCLLVLIAAAIASWRAVESGATRGPAPAAARGSIQARSQRIRSTPAHVARLRTFPHAAAGARRLRAS